MLDIFRRQLYFRLDEKLADTALIIVAAVALENELSGSENLLTMFS